MVEELKIIMDAVAQLGQAGKEAFMWWLIVKYGMHYVTVAFVILAAAFVATRIIKAVKSHQAECALVNEVAEKAGVRPCYHYSPHEYAKMAAWVRGK